MLNLSFVKTFITLVETGNYGETAKRLALSQPTVSQQIRKLETILGATLIHRSNAACTPTFHGRAVLPYARALLASADRFAAAAAGNHVCIGCSGNIATYFISGELKKFVEREPSPFHWDIRAAANPDLGDLLEGGEIDLAAMEWPDRRPGFKVTPWRREPLVVVVPKDHALARAKRLSVEQLLGLELIGGERGSGTGTLLKAALGKKTDRLRISHNLHSTEAVKNAVRAGLGCSIILKGAVEDEAKSGQFAMLTLKDAQLEKTFYIETPADLPPEALPSRLAAFLTAKHATQSSTRA